MTDLNNERRRKRKGLGKSRRYMEKLIYLVHWDDNAADTYLYGSRILFHENGIVEYENRRMPSGTVIRSWYSQADYQAKRLASQLPVLEEGGRYLVRSFVTCRPEKGILLRFQFYDRQKHLISFSVLDEKEGVLECPEGTYNYELQLIQTGSDFVRFHHVEIIPLDENDIDMSLSNGSIGAESLFGRLWNPDICSDKMNILLPELSGGMFRFPEEQKIWGISNFTVAPTEYVMSGEFFSDHWLQNEKWKRFREKRLLACGKMGREAALNLEYTQPADILVLKSLKDLYELEPD